MYLFLNALGSVELSTFFIQARSFVNLEKQQTGITPKVLKNQLQTIPERCANS